MLLKRGFGPASHPDVSNVSEKHRKERLMSSLGNGTWEGLALAQRTLGNKAGFGFNSVNCME